MLADFEQLTMSLVRDETSQIALEDRDRAIKLAVERYSGDRPRLAVQDTAADGSNYLPLPAGWQDGFSRLVEIETPPEQVPPSLLDPESWAIYNGLTTRIMLDSPPRAGQQVRLRYTVRHQLGHELDTIPLADQDAVCSWAASLLLEQLASHYSGHRQPTIAADSVDWQAKGRDYARRARDLAQRYFDRLGLDPKRNSAAGAVVALERPTSHPHGRLRPWMTP